VLDSPLVRGEGFCVQCVNCGSELIAGKKFCHNCGAPAVAPCPNCGAAVDPGFRFCPDCGFRLAAETKDNSVRPEAAIVPQSVAPANDRIARLPTLIPAELAQKILDSKGSVVGARKLVTVLFCDLVGSTAIAERLDPEEYRDLLGEYLEVAFREVYKFEGIVNQLAGDGVMALFGAPIAHEDAPQRAVRAALGVRDALRGLNEQLRARRGFELQARFGINTGPVVVGAVGNDLKLDYTAIGDTTNLAARLQSLAEAGTILLSETTYRRVRGFFQLQPAGVFDVKGKSDPVAAYRVLRESEATTPMAIAAARGLTPLVGRDAELAQLHACYQRLAEHLAQVVAVVGEAGSGKSRLIYEFKRQLAAEDVVFLEGRCSSMSHAVPYAPWTSMLRQHFDLSPGDSGGCPEKLAQELHSLGKDFEDLLPYLCQMLSFGTDRLADVSADELKRGEFEAMARLIGGLSKRSPVIMLIEDLHWIDEPSREMLELAATRLHGRIMLIVSHRPDYIPFWRTEAAFTQLRLRALSDNDTTTIIRDVAGAALPLDLEQLIRVKAEGNPFFAEEIVRALIEEGHVVRANEHLQLARPLEQIRIPGTVEEVIAARVDRFGPDAKRVSQVAAVLGRQFRRSHLLRLLAEEPVDVPAALDELERRGVIHRKTVLSGDEYRFGESLTQEVAYEALLLKERRQLHERIGHMLEEEAIDNDPELPALLAHHFALSDNREKAIEALLHAAQRAEHLPSYDIAVRCYRQAWDLAADTMEKNGGAAADERSIRAAVAAAVGLCRMVVIYSVPDDGASERAAHRGRELANALGDQANVAALWTYQGMLIINGSRERFAEGLSLLERGMTVARDAGVPNIVRNMSRGLGWGYMYDGRLDLALQTFTAAFEDVERSEDRERLSDLYFGSRFMRDQALFYSDNLQAALSNASQTYELGVRASNRTVQSGSAAIVALVHLAAGDYAEARRWADRSLEVAEAIGNIAAGRSAAIAALTARLELHEPVVAAGYIDLIEQGFLARGDMAVKSIVAVEALLMAGEVQRAKNYAEVAYAHAGGRLREAICATACGDVMRHLGEDHWEQAADWYAHAISLAASIGSRSTLVAAHLGAGELAAARGDRQGATTHLQQALAGSQATGLTRYRNRAQRPLDDLNSVLKQSARGGALAVGR
jgi:class 3 adenylate cyclase/tetratricopeptide (TPR) repeat protein/ABC-type lipoprotein export system ATPase subunit